MYPPNTVALGCLYTASLLATLEPPSSPLAEAQSESRLANILREKGDWEQMYMAEAEDLEGCELFKLHFIHQRSPPTEIAHIIIDLLIQAAQNPSANTSPRTPASPSPHPSPRNQHFSTTGTPQPPAIPYKADQLIHLKIMMRQNEHPLRPQQPLNADPSELYNENDIAMLGRNQGTVRFLFGPPGVVGQGA